MLTSTAGSAAGGCTAEPMATRRCCCQRVFVVRVHNQRFCSSTCRERILGARKRGGGRQDYGHQHKKTREDWKPVIQAGDGWCHAPVCKHPTRWIPPDLPDQPTGWHLDHNPHGGYRGPAHKGCNLSDGAVRGNQMRGRYTSSTPRIAR